MDILFLQYPISIEYRGAWWYMFKNTLNELQGEKYWFTNRDEYLAILKNKKLDSSRIIIISFLTISLIKDRFHNKCILGLPSKKKYCYMLNGFGYAPLIKKAKNDIYLILENNSELELFVYQNQFSYLKHPRVHFVSYAGINTKLFYNNPISYKKKDKLNVGITCRKAPEKGFIFFSREVKFLQKTHPDKFNFFTIGDYTSKDLKDVPITSLGWVEQYLNQYLNFRDTKIKQYLHQVYSNWDIYVNPQVIGKNVKFMEGILGTTIEIGLMGVPLISTNQFNMYPLVDNEDYLNIPIQNSEKIVSHLLALYENIELRKKLGTSGRKKFYENFNHQIIMKKIISIVLREN